MPSPSAPPFELRHLRLLVAVADTLSFTQAAASLHVAPQAVSAGVRQLEERLGVRVFERTSRTVRLTPAGAVLLDRARSILAEAAGAADAARAAARALVAPLRIGFVGHGAAELTTPITRALETASPGLAVELVRHDFTDVTGGLATKAVDAAFLWAPVPHPALTVEPLFAEPRVVLVPRDRELAVADEVTLADLSRLPCIVAHGADGDPVLAAWSDFHSARVLPDGTQRPIGATVRNAEEELEAVAAGRGARPVPASTTAFFSHPAVTAVPAPALPQATCVLGWRTSAPPDVLPLLQAAARRAAAGRERRPLGQSLRSDSSA